MKIMSQSRLQPWMFKSAFEKLLVLSIITHTALFGRLASWCKGVNGLVSRTLLQQQSFQVFDFFHDTCLGLDWSCLSAEHALHQNKTYNDMFFFAAWVRHLGS